MERGQLGNSAEDSAVAGLAPSPSCHRRAQGTLALAITHSTMTPIHLSSQVAAYLGSTYTYQKPYLGVARIPQPPALCPAGRRDAPGRLRRFDALDTLALTPEPRQPTPQLRASERRSHFVELSSFAVDGHGRLVQDGRAGLGCEVVEISECAHRGVLVSSRLTSVPTSGPLGRKLARAPLTFSYMARW